MSRMHSNRIKYCLMASYNDEVEGLEVGCAKERGRGRWRGSTLGAAYASRQRCAGSEWRTAPVLFPMVVIVFWNWLFLRAAISRRRLSVRPARPT